MDEATFRRAQSTDEFVQRDEDALVQQRLHGGRLRRSSTVAGSSGDQRRNPDAEASSGDAPRVGGAQESKNRSRSGRE